MAIQRVENVNRLVLRECREQLRLSLDELNKQKKFQFVVAAEEGEYLPTFKQLNDLSELYGVPRWVFIAEKLPEEYQFASTPAFRKFAGGRTNEIFKDYKIRKLIVAVERLRDLILELREDNEEPVNPFNPSELGNINSAENAAQKVREWLGASASYDFEGWRAMLEKKNIFVFLTSKYNGWAKMNRKCRGLSIYHDTLPIIIINDSDYRKALGFTLFHELGHILHRESELDAWEESEASEEAEKWCDEFAGNVLMPGQEFLAKSNDWDNDLASLKKISRRFKVSDYACLVRMRHLGKIDWATYRSLQESLQKAYEERNALLKRGESRISRNRASEVLNQYGHIYANVVFQTYRNQEIGLHKLCKLFDLKRPSQIFDLEKIL